MTMDHHLLRIINFCSVVLLLPHVTVISFAPPRSIAPLSYVGQRGQRMQWRRRENKATNDEDTSDFVNNISRQLEEEEKARQFTRQFYKELENRQNRLSEFEWNVETYNVRGNFVDETGAQGRTHTNRTGFKSNTSTTNSNRRIFANQSPKRPSLSQSNPPISFPSFPPFFSFPIFPSPTTAPATSAGLFSGAGATVYSSGGTRRADIEILELTMKNDELKSRDNFSWKAIYLGNPEQIEHATKFIVGSLILLSAVYFAVGMSGASIEGTLVVDLSMIDGAVSGAKEASAIVEDILEGAAGSVIAGVGKAGEGICWLEEPAALAGSVVEVFSRSVEKLLIGA